MFSLYPSLFWKLRDKRTQKIYNFDPKASELSKKIDISNVAYSRASFVLSNFPLALQFHDASIIIGVGTHAIVRIVTLTIQSYANIQMRANRKQNRHSSNDPDSYHINYGNYYTFSSPTLF